MLTWGKENQSFNTQNIHLPIYICVTIKLLVYTNLSYTNLHKCYNTVINSISTMMSQHNDLLTNNMTFVIT